VLSKCKNYSHIYFFDQVHLIFDAENFGGKIY